MAALSVQVPYPVFYDRDGQPLENGNIYIGTANLDPVTNQIPVYYDEALTIAASQPLKTSGGYIYRNGTPTQLYVDASNFSIAVKDSKNTLVYSFPNGTGIGADASSIEYNPPFPDAVTSGYTVSDKLAQYVSVKDFGAVGDGVTDDTAAIQNAINYAIYFSSGTLDLVTSGMKVFLPRGTYKTTDTLHLGYGVNGYTSIVFEGECQYGIDASTILSGIAPTFNDRPAINIQGGRNVSVRRIVVVGVNYSWLETNYNSITDRSVVANWYGPNISAANNTRNAPYCGICIDAYSNAAPAIPYPPVTYPAFLGSVSQYNKAYSSVTTLDEVSVHGFVVGLMVQPGNSPSASQGDFVTVRDSNLSYNVVNYADGHADARNPNIYNTRLDNAHTAIDGRTYGSQVGQIAVNADGCSFDRVYQVFNIDLNGASVQGSYSATLKSCYGEGLNCLGTVCVAGSIPAAVAGGLAITETKFSFNVKSAEYSPTYIVSAPSCDIYLRNIIFQGGYSFYNFNGNLTAEGITTVKPIADVFSPTSGTPNKVAKSYTCNIFAPKAYHVRANPNEFYKYFGSAVFNMRADSDNFPMDLEASAAPGTGYGYPIPWFVQNMVSGTTQYPVSNVAPLVLNRVTYNLSAVSLTDNQYTFTCDNAFITDAVGANTDAPFYVGKGDIVVDSVSGQVYAVISVSFSGTGPGTTMTATIRQLNNVRWSGSAWVAGGSLSTNTGTLTFYNARRFYPSAYRVNFTATSGSGNIDLKICGNETNVNFMTLPVEVDDYLISSAISQSAADSVFPKFSKVTVSNINTGAVTLNQNARRSYYGETPLFVKVL